MAQIVFDFTKTTISSNVTSLFENRIIDENEKDWFAKVVKGTKLKNAEANQLVKSILFTCPVFRWLVKNGSLNTRLNLVQYSNVIWIPDHFGNHTGVTRLVGYSDSHCTNNNLLLLFYKLTHVRFFLSLTHQRLATLPQTGPVSLILSTIFQNCPQCGPCV